jgi:CIC family chloride channel protein
VAQVEFREYEERVLPLVAVVISAVVGLVVVAFVVLTERLGARLLTAGPLQRFLSPLMGSLAAGFLLFRLYPEARGSGIPQTRVALLLQKGFISLRTVAGKFICSSITLGSGIALGREGPSVHIGAGIASVAGRRLGLSEESVRSLIPVGTAAAVAAAFNTPLAAVLFTLEEILADLHARVVGSVVIGAATSWIVLRLILGDEPLFHVPSYQLVHPVEFLIYALLGLAGGLVSALFVKLLLRQRAGFLRVPMQWRPLAPAAGGLLVGALALAAPGVLGVGYNLVGEALNDQMPMWMMLLLLLLKLIATSTSYASGNAGGIFGPSLFIGAMLGGSVGQVAHWLLPDHTGNAGAYALVGMGAAFAGIIRSPMTSVIMIFELTRDYSIIVPLMIANLCSYLLAQRMQKLPTYEALSRQDGVILPSHEHRPPPLTVERAMRTQALPDSSTASSVVVPSVHPDDPLDMALQIMGRAEVSELTVIGRAGGVVGRISADDAVAAYRDISADPRERESRAAPARNMLPAIVAATAAAVFIVSGLVVWQRWQRHDLGIEAYRSGEGWLAQGRVDEAVQAFRSGLAHTPQDARMRAALGLALIRSGHLTEAASYLTDAAKADPANGPVILGLAEIARRTGDHGRALRLYRQALSLDWPAQAESMRSAGQFSYASLLADNGRKSEAIAQFMSIIEQKVDDPALGKKAAETIRANGTPDQTEAAYLTLARQFPADSSIWFRLGDARFSAGKETAALEAYRRALKADPDDATARDAGARVEEVLRVDPTRRGLTVRQRTQRLDEVLRRVIAALDACGESGAAGQARPLLKKRVTRPEVSDAKMAAAVAIWFAASAACRKDPVMSHIMNKLRE